MQPGPVRVDRPDLVAVSGRGAGGEEDLVPLWRPTREVLVVQEHARRRQGREAAAVELHRKDSHLIVLIKADEGEPLPVGGVVPYTCARRRARLDQRQAGSVG